MRTNSRLLLSPLVLVIAATAATPTVAQKNYAPGVNDTQIKIGQTMPYSGTAAAWGAMGQAELAYFKMINDRGGINGRKIVLISRDDGFNPSKTVEQTRKLVEEDGVAFLFGSAGPGNLAVRKYLNDHRIPQLFIAAPLAQYNNPQHFPWTMGLPPTFTVEGQNYARYILGHKPDARIGVLYENNHTNESAKALREGLGDKAEKLIVKELSYEEADPTINSQMVALQASGANTFYDATSPKFAAQAIRKAAELGWKPLHLLSFGAQSISAVLEPAGLENSIGIISANFVKDPTDPQWKDDSYTRAFLDWIHEYYPGGKPADIFISYGYDFAQPLVYLLNQCGDDLSRENIMRQAANLHGVTMPWLLPGITLNTSPNDYQPIKDMREMRFNGKTWDLLSE
jgi:branched-chain amino acid transport system substrate-binding protein